MYYACRATCSGPQTEGLSIVLQVSSRGRTCAYLSSRWYLQSSSQRRRLLLHVRLAACVARKTDLQCVVRQACVHKLSAETI
jgi:hypothetical protein